MNCFKSPTFFKLLLLSLILMGIVNSERNKKRKNSEMCAVCRAIVSEVNWAVSQVDPKKSIQVGSFRVDTKGNQPNIKEKKYARSETHLEEIFESICDKMNNYAELSNDDGSKHIVKTSGFGDKRLDTKGLKLDYSVGSRLKYKCEDLLEEYEENMITLLQRENIPDYEKVICGSETRVCSLEELSKQLVTLPEASVENDNIDNDGDEEGEYKEDESINDIGIDREQEKEEL